MPKKQLLIILTSPSGGGKSTICDRLLADYPEIVYSVSLTTRDPRGDEQDGEDYHFVSESGFRKRIEDGEFLEHAVVHGERYGTLRQSIENAFADGLSVILDIDVAGAEKIRQSLRDLDQDHPLRRGFVDIFIMPPSLEVLRQRLENRGLDSPETIARRLYNAQAEIQASKDFKYRVLNENLDHAYRELREIVEMESTGQAAPAGDDAGRDGA